MRTRINDLKTKTLDELWDILYVISLEMLYIPF